MNMNKAILDAVNALDPMEKRVMTLCYGLEDGHARTLEEVGKELNINAGGVREIRVEALRKLRHPACADRGLGAMAHE